MKHERATEELKELAALYALGSLTQNEARSFELHVKEGCSACGAELEKFERAAAKIGLAAGELAAPEYIRDLLSARIEREPRAAGKDAQPDPASQPKPVSESRPALAALSMSAPGREGPNLLLWVVIAALVVLGLMAAYSWKSAGDINTQLEARLSAALSDAGSLRAMLDAGKEKAGNLDRLVEALGKPGTRIARLLVQTTSPAHSAAVIWDTGEQQCYLLGNFPPAPAGKNYQLWFFTRMARVSAGSFKTTGRTFATIPVPPDAADAGAAVVTLEPDNGSQIPTSPYYAVGRIE